jgi:hypothetical protein
MTENIANSGFHLSVGQLNRRNLAAQRWSVVLLVFNFIGAVVYVVAASNG